MALKRALLAAAFSLVFTSDSFAETKKPGLQAFFLHYVIVLSMKETGMEKKDKSTKIFAFMDKMPRRSDALADFWWAWALRDCHSYLDNRLQFYTKTFKEVAYPVNSGSSRFGGLTS